MIVRGIDGLLLRFPRGVRPKGRPSTIGVAGARVAPKFHFAVRAGRGRGAGVAANGAEWHRVALSGLGLTKANGWDAAHEALSGMIADGGPQPTLVEPDWVQEWPDPRHREADGLGVAGEACAFDDQDSDLPCRRGEFGWHLGDGFSQLAAARRAAGLPGGRSLVRIAHLDTGYDPEHATCPTKRIDKDLERNFTGEGDAKSARDPGVGGIMKNPGHGTGTLGILAGARFAFAGSGYGFNDDLGGAPNARIVPVRVGSSVVQLRTADVAQGIDYAARLCDREGTRVHVLSMSMGGVASEAWADAVNKAYEAGVVLVTAAGNNFSGGLFAFPTRFIVYPARFRRVIAACGVMADGTPYFGLRRGAMQGNWGPKSKMATAMAAYTPNVPWAQYGCKGIVDMDGAGTSAATPQVAAAAALYCQTHARELASYPNPWMRVEAVRRALFDSAGQPNEKSDREKLGRGALRAREALEVRPAKAADLEKTGEDSVGFAFLRVLTGMGLTGGEPRARMLGLEAAQLAQRWSRQDEPNPFEAAVPDPDSDQVPPSQRRTFLELVGGHAAASAPLRRWANVVLDGLVRGAKAPRPRGRSAGDKAGASDVAARDRLRPGLAHAGRPAFTPPPPPFRRLRGYAIDPSLSTQLDLAPVGQVTFEVPWEKLEPGPVGEYLEVVDIDPASGCLYEPVDLNAPALLAQDGLPPSEGTPQFHQQMVYAVASLTIRNFERALGRRALWRPGPSLDPRNPEDDSHYVQRLRVHPHALREANAYYSPQKVGLLFGYFGASGDDPAGHMPAARVFSCLSHDIVAHETTHALLDGMHRQLLIASNPDVHAFHEAFADIVALFQHFTFPEILRHQIAQTRGGLRVHQSLLGELATQFGRSTGLRGALRDAIGTFKDGVWTPHVPKPNEFEEAQESHDRGAFLVAAVFDAFLAIYERRVADLFRLSTGGTGVLSPGAIHPDLVNRLAAEATKSAQHVLTMCIRALDYCPPTDITFGEYLRALITADYDLVPNDDLHYRIAFVEAFRRRGIYPRDLRTLSVESLLWRGPHNEDRPPSDKLGALFEQLRPFAGQFLHAVSREEVFSLQRLMRRDLHGRLERHFGGGTDGARDAEFLGINPRLKSGFEVHSARVALRPSPDGDVRSQLLIGLLQRTRNIPIDPQGRESREGMTFAGGSTIIADLRGLGVQYCVRKSMKSDSRRGRQRAFALSRHGSLRATYLGIGAGGRGEHLDEPFAMLHRGL